MSSTTPVSARGTRSSLACLPCRSRHAKCDGTKPSCNRCAELNKPCEYARSRRGGLDRGALEERRKRLAAAKSTTSPTLPTTQPSADAQINLEFTPEDVEMEFPNSYSFRPTQTWGDGPGMALPSASLISLSNIETDPLIDSYYNNFHAFHPFLLPRNHFTRLCQDPSTQLIFKPLIAVMRLVGHIYSARSWSIPLKEHAETCFMQTSATDPVMVQCRLLYSIALFWYEHKLEAKLQVNSAIELAIRLKMHEQEFASRHGATDPTLRECWRRTWWMLYIIDAYYAGTLGAMNFAACDIPSTVELPCEESEYESGNIPKSKTLDEFECREFDPDNIVYSSFAYLIGAVRCAALAISFVSKFAKKEDSPQVQVLDSALDGWLLSLPKNAKQVISKAGEVDELIFQAHLVIHVSSIGLHRPFSDLKFNPVESVSSCAREPPLDTQTPDLVNVHTVRVLRATEAQIRLLTLPMPQFKHTPFTTCMVSEGTLSLLSACNFLLKDKDLMIARDQIRVAIGCLKVLAEIWPRIARNVREIQTIAQSVLGLGPKSASDSDSAKSSDVPGLSPDEGQGSLESDLGGTSDHMDTLPSLALVGDLCGWYSMDSLDPDISWDSVPQV